jgi:hypothetical protein
MAYGAFVALALPEWVGWLEQREFRCLYSRVRRFVTDDGAAFKRLLETAPFIDIDDEGAFIIVRIHSDFMASAEVSDSFDGADVIRIPLRLVYSFHAVSARAQSLLEIEAQKWSCRIEPPLNSQAWDEWCAEQADRRAHKRGLVIARFFGFSTPPSPKSRAAGREELATTRALQDDKRVDHEHCASLGWAEAFAHCRERLGENANELVAATGPVTQLVKDRKNAYSLADESFVTSAAFAAIDHAENLLLERSARPVAVLPTAAFHHYKFVFSIGRTPDERLIRSLGQAISAVRLRYDDELAWLLAYEIGRLFPESYAAVLEKHLDCDLYTALSPVTLPFDAATVLRLPDGLDVRRRDNARSMIEAANAPAMTRAVEQSTSQAPPPEPAASASATLQGESVAAYKDPPPDNRQKIRNKSKPKLGIATVQPSGFTASVDQHPIAKVPPLEGSITITAQSLDTLGS